MRFSIHSIEGNRQWLDGGAMFGNAPRAVWERWMRPDARGRIELATRSFLVEDSRRGEKLLLDLGVGACFEPKLADRFGVAEREHRLIQNLAAVNVDPQEIDWIILSHLHFDHVGGAAMPYQAGAPLQLAFPNAKFVISKSAWARACDPHPRDRASFFPEVNQLISESNRLVLIDPDKDPLDHPFDDTFQFRISDGHTPGMLLTQISTEQGAVVFCADVIPGTAWIHVPISMGYDRFPELLIDEKAALLDWAEAGHVRLLFTHDPTIASCCAQRDSDGRYVAIDRIEHLVGYQF